MRAAHRQLTDLRLYFGKLTITMMSLFMSVTDGLSWETLELARQLRTSPPLYNTDGIQ